MLRVVTAEFEVHYVRLPAATSVAQRTRPNPPAYYHQPRSRDARRLARRVSRHSHGAPTVYGSRVPLMATAAPDSAPARQLMRPGTGRGDRGRQSDGRCIQFRLPERLASRADRPSTSVARARSRRALFEADRGLAAADLARTVALTVPFPDEPPSSGEEQATEPDGGACGVRPSQRIDPERGRGSCVLNPARQVLEERSSRAAVNATGWYGWCSGVPRAESSPPMPA